MLIQKISETTFGLLICCTVTFRNIHWKKSIIFECYTHTICTHMTVKDAVNHDILYLSKYDTGIVWGVLTSIGFVCHSSSWLLLQAAHGDTCTVLQQPLNSLLCYKTDLKGEKQQHEKRKKRRESSKNTFEI